MPGGFPLQDTGPGMGELFHDLQVEQEERRAKERCQHPPCRETDYCGWAAYCGAEDFIGPSVPNGERQ